MKKLVLLPLLTLLILSSCNGDNTSSSKSTSTSEPTSTSTSVPTSEPTSTPTSESTSKLTSEPTSQPSSITTLNPSTSTTSYEPFTTTIDYDGLPGHYLFEYKGGSNIKGTFEAEFVFKDEFLSLPSNEPSKEFALVSYGLACSANYYDKAKAVLEYLEFDDLYLTPYYKEETDINKCAYTFAHKKLGDNDIVAVLPRSGDYYLEWVNNFALGRSGDHQGFKARAEEIYADLKDYLKDKGYENIKFYLAGYSRGGAFANIVSHYIMSRQELEYVDLYCYTFECPKGLALDNAPKYENVFNFYNSGELIPYLAPTQFGLTRCGTDIDMYSPRLDEYMAYFYGEAELTPFSPNEKFANETEYCEYVISLLDQITFDGENYLTREILCDKYSEVTAYLLPLLGQLDIHELEKLASNIMAIPNVVLKVFLLGNFMEIRNAVKAILDENNIEYDEETLFSEINNLCVTVKTLASPVVTEFMMRRNNIMRAALAHDYKAVFALLSAF